MKLLFVNLVDISNIQANSFPNLGLGYIASYVKVRVPSVEFRVVASLTLEEIRSWQPDIIGITSVSQCYNEAMACAKIAKSVNLPVLIGGIHISAIAQTMTHDMDIAVLGEGEQTTAELLALYLSEGKFNKDGLQNIDGIAFVDNGVIVKTNPRAMIQPLDSIPFPDRSILRVNPNLSGIFSSRGCLYRCVYCSTHRHWGKIRYFSADYVASEIEYIYKTYKVKCINLLDDLFIVDHQRLTDVISLLEKKNILGRMSFITNVRSNLVTDDLARMLKYMNVIYVGMGIESGCQKTLEYLKGKGNITIQDHYNAIRILRKHRIEPHPSFIIGAPNETRDDLMETINFIKNTKLTGFEVYVLIPFPDTPVWEYARLKGLVGENMDWSRLFWDFNNNHNPVILSEKLTEYEIRGFYNQLINRRTKYIKRAYIKGMLLGVLMNPLAVPKYITRKVRRIAT